MALLTPSAHLCERACQQQHSARPNQPVPGTRGVNGIVEDCFELVSTTSHQRRYRRTHGHVVYVTRVLVWCDRCPERQPKGYEGRSNDSPGYDSTAEERVRGIGPSYKSNADEGWREFHLCGDGFKCQRMSHFKPYAGGEYSRPRTSSPP